ncbi:hypothetical protein AB0R01_14910 [Streptomyces rochei]|uniref:hypothetical protein n=1 Tax=Streptomyces rochei TaxID=1928 RepID=UPI003412EC04
MTENQKLRALPPVEASPGVLVHPASDRALATEHWLLATHREPRRARLEWQEHQLAVLPLGALFSACRLPARLVLALAGGTGPSREVDAVLAEVLEGGPVICDPHGHRYYALVPATMPTSWRAAFRDWEPAGVEALGRGAYLGVPRVDLTAYDPRIRASYWSVPMTSAATLCAPLAVARLITAAQQLLPSEGTE